MREDPTWQQVTANMAVESVAYAIGRGTIHRCATNDIEQVSLAARDAMQSTIRGAGEVGAEVCEAIRGTSRGLIEGAAEQGGNLATLVRSLLNETSSEARRLGFDPVQALGAAIGGALDAKCDMDDIAASQVADAIRQTIIDYKLPHSRTLLKRLTEGSQD